VCALQKSVWLWCVLVLSLAACGPAQAGVVVEWTTANEVNTAGFNLYRSDSPDGPFVQINASLIPASADPLTGGQYAYEDTAVQAGQTYYYLLEDVEYSGQTTRHGPIESTAPGLAPPLALGLALGLAALAAAAVFGLAARRNSRNPAAPHSAPHDSDQQTAPRSSA